jgi:hypothetical protein
VAAACSGTVNHCGITGGLALRTVRWGWKTGAGGDGTHQFLPQHRESLEWSAPSYRSFPATEYADQHDAAAVCSNLQSGDPTTHPVVCAGPTSGPFRVLGLDVAKSSVEIAAPNFKIMRSYQTSLGVQRDLGHDMVLKVDWAWRQFENADLAELDLNRFNRPSGPVIPKCAVLPDFNPADQCSNGSMTFWVPQGRSIYEAMLLEVDKRLSNHLQFPGFVRSPKSKYGGGADARSR